MYFVLTYALYIGFDMCIDVHVFLDILYCMDVNFCSGHGDCVSMPGYDLCDCEPGWKGPHCAESKLLIGPV